MARGRNRVSRGSVVRATDLCRVGHGFDSYQRLRV